MGSPVYFLACTGGTAGAAAGAGWVFGAGFCGSGGAGWVPWLANASSFPVSQPGSGICGNLEDARICFTGPLAGRSAAGITASAGDVDAKEIIRFEPSAWALKGSNSARSITTRDRPGWDCPKRTARTGTYWLRTEYLETARLVFSKSRTMRAGFSRREVW